MSDCRTGPRWSKGEDEVLKQLVDIHGSQQQWEIISTNLENRTGKMCKNRWNKLMEMGHTRGPWTDEEDKIIVEAVEQGINKWSEIAKLVPGNRIGKQCRERWFNHLSPELKKSPWSDEEDRILVETQAVIGNSCSKVAIHLPGRSENEVKNRWYSAVIRKKLLASASQPPDEGESAVGTPDSLNRVSRTVGKKRGGAHVRNDDCLHPPTTQSCSSTASSFKPATKGSTQYRPVLSSDDQISLRVAEVYLRSTMSMQTAKHAPYAPWSTTATTTGAGVGSLITAPVPGGGALWRSYSSFNSLSGFDERGVLSSSHTRHTTKDSAALSLCLDGGDDADEGSHRYAHSGGLGLRVNTDHTARHTGHSGFKKLCASFQDNMICADGLLLNSAGLLESMSELTTPWVGLSACASACTSPLWMDCGTAPPSPPTLPDGVSSAVLYPTQLNK